MTETDDIDDPSGVPLEIEGRIENTETFRPRWTVLLRPVQTFVGLLPSHKNTRKGRRAARQIKVVVAVVAFLAVVAAQSTIAIVVGLVALALVPWVPISQVRKRSWVNRLKSMREPRDRTVEQPVIVRFDGESMTLENGEASGRSDTIDSADIEASVGSSAERVYLKVESAPGNGSETVWIATDELDEDDLPDEWPVHSDQSDDVDRPAVVGGEDWRRLADRLL